MYNLVMKPKKSILNLKAYPAPLFAQEGYLRLDSNESDFGPSPKVIEALNKVNAADLQYYPHYGDLVEKLADFHKVSIDNIILTSGADEGISGILGTFLEHGQTVLTVAPTFVMPKLYSQRDGLIFKEIPYNSKWKFPSDEFLRQIESADLIHLTTPNSPTGEVIEQSTIVEIVKKAGAKAVLIDETYANYAGVTNLDLIRENDNVFITRSFSKDFALAGLRLGYIISDAENIAHLRKFFSPYNVSNISVKAGMAALDDVAYLDNVKSELEESKKLLTQGFNKLGAHIYPSKSNFICVDFGSKAEFVYKKLLQNKIKVKFFDKTPLLENHLRIGIPKLENAKKLIKAIEAKPTIVFDMDGVLIDASKSYRVAVQKTFNKFSGKEVTMEEISQTKKLGGLNNDWDLTEFLLKKYGFDVEYDKIVDTFNEYYRALADIEAPLIDHEFFQNLSNDYHLAIFTGRVKEEAFFTLDKHGFADYFYPIITMEEVGFDRQKPDSYGLELIKEKIITDKIYYLGDTVDDMVCAISAKAAGIGVLPPQDKSEELATLLKSKNAMVVLEQTTDLIEFLTKKEISNRK